MRAALLSRYSFPAAVLGIALSWGCAGAEKPVTGKDAPAPEAEAPPRPAGRAREAAAEVSGEEEASEEPSLRKLCRQRAEGERPALESMRQRIAETFCGATLWLDGMFGDEPDIENARAVSGRVKLFGIQSEFEGTDIKVRLRVKYDLPNLERRLNVFLGREDEMDFVEDQRESSSVRTSLFGLEEDEEWLAGLGYRPPGKWRQRFDFRVGGRLSSSPEIFVQSRMRHNIFQGEYTVWRFRQTLFWENRDGFGLTSKAEMDRLLRTDLLARWGSVATISEATDGVRWRTSGLLYQSLTSRYALAYEVFVRGATDHEVPLREYGVRNVLRRPLHHQWLFGELLVGYTWPRESLDMPREGSALIGLGVELYFGENPY